MLDPDDFETTNDFLTISVPEDVFGRLDFKAEDGRWYWGNYQPQIEPIDDPHLLKQLEAEDDETEPKDEGDETTDGK